MSVCNRVENKMCNGYITDTVETNKLTSLHWLAASNDALAAATRARRVKTDLIASRIMET